MAQAERSIPERGVAPLPAMAAEDRGFLPGGQVGQWHAELAQRLASPDGLFAPMVESPGERMVRIVSRAGGFVALLAGYAIVALLMLR